MTETIIQFKEFFLVPNLFFQILGVAKYGDQNLQSERKVQRVLLNIWFWVSFINLLLGVLGELIYVVLGIGDFENFLSVTAVTPCLALASMALEELLLMWRKRSQFDKLLAFLEEVYPKNVQDQETYNIPQIKKQLRTVMINFASAYSFLICAFNFVPLTVIIIDYFKGMGFKRELPYFMWFPFDPYKNVVIYLIVYFLETIAGFSAVLSVMAVNLFVGSVIMQFCIQIDILAMKFRNLKPKKENFSVDMKNFGEIIKSHSSIMDHWKEAEDCFSLSIFVNYMMSSLIICLVGFQITAGVESANIFKYILFLLCSLIQTMAMSYFGNQIIERSSNIAEAIYENEWFDADVRYKKCLVMVMARTRKPLTLTGLNFTTVSLESFTKILSTSYSYFALLRTMYDTTNN